MNKQIQKLLLGLCVIIIISGNSIYAEELIKLNESSVFKTMISPQESKFKSGWDDFLSKHPNWHIQIDKASQSPAIAFGKPIKIIEPMLLNDSEMISKAIFQFLHKYRKAFDIDVSELELTRIDTLNNSTYVNFAQNHNALKVNSSNLLFIINSRGELYRFNISYYKIPDLQLANIDNPTITSIQATQAVDKLLTEKYNLNHKLRSIAEPERIIIPKYEGDKIEYITAYIINTQTSIEFLTYTSYVDVSSGKVVYLNSNINNFSDFQVKVRTVDTYNFTPMKYYPLANGILQDENGYTIFLDKEGKYNKFLSSDKLTYNYSTQDARVAIYYDKQGENKVEVPKLPLNFNSEKVAIIDTNGYNKYFNFALVHFKIAKDWIISIDPSVAQYYKKQFKLGMIKKDPSYPEEMSQVNAFYSPGLDYIAFTDFENDSMPFSSCPSILYHEFGHSINDYFYRARNIRFDNTTCNEALADVNSALMIDNSKVGIGAFKNDLNKTIRNLENEQKYPENMRDDSHYDSQILSGTIWDLRKVIGLEKSKKLMQAARYSLPNDMDVETAFKEWLLGYLTADDDNGDLSDGTPNMKEILKAFNKHNIGVNLLYKANADFAKLNDIPLKEKQLVKVTINSLPIPIDLPSSIYFIYYTDNYKQKDTIQLKKNGNVYSGEVIAFDKIETVKYEVLIKSDDLDITLKRTHKEKNDYIYKVGYHQLMIENFEKNNLDISTSGTKDGFMVLKPKPFYSALTFSFQPKVQMTQNGEKCLSLGDVPNFKDQVYGILNQGESYAITPNYPLKQTNGKYYCSFWIFENFLFYESDLDDNSTYFTISYKTDLMNNWEKMYEIDKQKANSIADITKKYEDLRYYWKNLTFGLNKVDKNCKNIQFKFEAKVSVPMQEDFFSNFFKILVDDLEVLSDQPAIVSVEDNPLFSNVKVFPNPISETTLIELSPEESSAICSLVDMKGNYLVSNVNIGRKTALRDIYNGNLPLGSYILEIKYANGEAQKIKIVK